MATNPTRLQDQACDCLAGALLLVAEATRLDGKGTLDAAAFARLARDLARASSSFAPDQIIARALNRRGRDLKLRTGTADLLSLVEPEETLSPLLLLPDDEFLARIAAAEDELGEV